VFALARDMARQASCLSNTRQIGTAVMMYAQDHIFSDGHVKRVHEDTLLGKPQLFVTSGAAGR
jgi:hypothetical protein